MHDACVDEVDGPTEGAFGVIQLADDTIEAKLLC